MAKQKSDRPKLNAGHVESALRKHIDVHAVKLIPEAAVNYTTQNTRGRHVTDTYRADYMMISASGYATEFEVKISRADWKNDLKKPKWDHMPPWIAQFIYVVPEYLGIPEWVPPNAGVWHVVAFKGSGIARIKVARAPKRIGKEKVPAEIIAKWMSNLYYRFWNMRREREKSLPTL
jgi:hypothetical protein